ncbi:MAG: protein of unknown function DUF125, transmembrane, partial [uncultured Rubrobacteraceae bacterium]
GRVDGEVGSRGSGDDGVRAQQGLRAQGGSAGPYWLDGRVCLDAGAVVRGGVLAAGPGVHDRAGGGCRGGDQHGLLRGSLRRRFHDRAGRSGAPGYDNGRCHLYRRHHAHAAVPDPGRAGGTLPGLRGRGGGVARDLLHPLQVLRDELLDERPPGHPRRRARLRLRHPHRQRL